MALREIYFSIDVETYGPIPGKYSMLSYAAVAFDDQGVEVGRFENNLELMKGAEEPHPKTKKFWDENPQAFEATRLNQVEPSKSIGNFIKWLKSLPVDYEYRCVFVGYPAGFDFTFIYWYLIYFKDYSPFSFSALDMKSYACAKLDIPYRDCVKRNFPKEWFEGLPHTHVAIDDAIEQGALFFKMKNWKK